MTSYKPLEEVPDTEASGSGSGAASGSASASGSGGASKVVGTY